MEIAKFNLMYLVLLKISENTGLLSIFQSIVNVCAKLDKVFTSIFPLASSVKPVYDEYFYQEVLLLSVNS